MSVLKPRSRMISVRLSEDEYSALQELSLTTGARSVSDLMRDSMRGLIDSSARDKGVGDYFEEFHARINILDRKVEELTKRVASSSSEQ